MTEHEITAPIEGEVRLVLDGNKPAGVDWEVTDLGHSEHWECSCGETFGREFEAADHLEKHA